MPAARAASLQRRLGLVPDLVRAHPLGRPIGEFDLHLIEAEVAVNLEDQARDRDRLLGDLILGDEDVRIVLGEGAHAHQAVQCARGLVAMHLAEFGTGGSAAGGSCGCPA